jgi:hypothetical protein
VVFLIKWFSLLFLHNSFEIDNVSVSVPDGGMTVTLLGLSLSGLAYFRRKLA